MTKTHYHTRTPDNRFSYLIAADSSWQARQYASGRTRGYLHPQDFMATPCEARIAPIPFAGFYHSWHESALENALNSLASDDNGGVIDSEYERLSDALDWRAAFLAYAQIYCERLADETGATWEFSRLDSPREYNFRSDEIDVTVSLAELQRMLDVAGLDALQTLATDRLTARSGFIPFYSSRIDEWGALDEWDSPLLGLLIECYCDAMGQDAESRDCWLIDDSNGQVTDCIEAGLRTS